MLCKIGQYMFTLAQWELIIFHLHTVVFGGPGTIHHTKPIHSQPNRTKPVVSQTVFSHKLVLPALAFTKQVFSTTGVSQTAFHRLVSSRLDFYKQLLSDKLGQHKLFTTTDWFSPKTSFFKKTMVFQKMVSQTCFHQTGFPNWFLQTGFPQTGVHKLVFNKTSVLQTGVPQTGVHELVFTESWCSTNWCSTDWCSPDLMSTKTALRQARSTQTVYHDRLVFTKN